MWYFTWILGTLLASSLAVVNAMWLEVNVLEAAEDAEPKPSEPEQKQ